MKHQYKERLAGVRKIALLPLCIGVLALFSFTENPVLVEPVLPMVSVTIKAETPKVVLPEVTVDSAGNEKDFLLLDTPKIVHYVQSRDAHIVQSGAGQPLAQVSIFVPKALDTLSAESSDGTFSQEQNINHTMDIDLRADQVVLSRAPRKIMHMCGSLNGLKKILVLLWLFQYIMTGIGCNLKRGCPSLTKIRRMFTVFVRLPVGLS